jgi:signal transduction histidine kinase
VDRNNDFPRQAAFGTMLAVRTSFPDGSLGALTLYGAAEGGFPDAVSATLSFLAMPVASLYSAVHDRVAYQLVNNVAGIVAETAVSREDVDRQLEVVCREICGALRCSETSIFLHDPLVEPGVFRLSATTNRDALRTEKYKSSDTGLTPWAVRSLKSIFVLDIEHMPVAIMEATRWTPRRPAEKADKGASNPHSFAAVPIISDGRAIGVMRCSTGLRAPYYFAEGEVRLLEILANRVANFLARWLRLRQMEFSGEKWRVFAEGIQGLGGFITDLTQKAKSSRTTAALRQEFYVAALTAAKNSIAGADALELALAEAPKKIIAPVAWVGAAWEKVMGVQPSFGRLPLSANPTNAWNYVYNRREVTVIQDTRNPGVPYANVVPETRQAIFVPVIVDTSCVGILGVRTSTRFTDIEQSTTMMRVIAMVLAQYHQMTTLLTQQAEVYQDLEHQLRSPVFQAYKRIQSLMDDQRRNSAMLPDTQIGDLNAVLGLIGKARRVLSNVRLYEELASGHTVRAKRDETVPAEIRKMLIEASRDNELLWVHKKILFKVSHDLLLTTKEPVPLDATLFEQVISNLLDNAGKYGAPNSAVEIDGIVDTDRQFRLTVKNKAGVALERSSIVNLGTRGFRTEQARRFTAEGIGSGLYLVKLIVEAHGGSFIPNETNVFGDTCMIVTFPLK